MGTKKNDTYQNARAVGGADDSVAGGHSRAVVVLAARLSLTEQGVVRASPAHPGTACGAAGHDLRRK